nr:uncharacterized protein LOC100198316 [Hydra vulgaris]
MHSTYVLLLLVFITTSYGNTVNDKIEDDKSMVLLQSDQDLNNELKWINQPQQDETQWDQNEKKTFGLLGNLFCNLPLLSGFFCQNGQRYDKNLYEICGSGVHLKNIFFVKMVEATIEIYTRYVEVARI